MLHIICILCNARTLQTSRIYVDHIFAYFPPVKHMDECVQVGYVRKPIVSTLDMSLNLTGIVRRPAPSEQISGAHPQSAQPRCKTTL